MRTILLIFIVLTGVAPRFALGLPDRLQALLDARDSFFAANCYYAAIAAHYPDMTPRYLGDDMLRYLMERDFRPVAVGRRDPETGELALDGAVPGDVFLFETPSRTVLHAGYFVGYESGRAMIFDKRFPGAQYKFRLVALDRAHLGFVRDPGSDPLDAMTDQLSAEREPFQNVRIMRFRGARRWPAGDIPEADLFGRVSLHNRIMEEAMRFSTIEVPWDVIRALDATIRSSYDLARPFELEEMLGSSAVETLLSFRSNVEVFDHFLHVYPDFLPCRTAIAAPPPIRIMAPVRSPDRRGSGYR